MGENQPSDAEPTRTEPLSSPVALWTIRSTREVWARTMGSIHRPTRSTPATAAIQRQSRRRVMGRTLLPRRARRREGGAPASSSVELEGGESTSGCRLRPLSWKPRNRRREETLLSWSGSTARSRRLFQRITFRQLVAVRGKSVRAWDSILRTRFLGRRSGRQRTGPRRRRGNAGIGTIGQSGHRAPPCGSIESRQGHATRGMKAWARTERPRVRRNRRGNQ